MSVAARNGWRSTAGSAGSVPRAPESAGDRANRCALAPPRHSPRTRSPVGLVAAGPVAVPAGGHGATGFAHSRDRAPRTVDISRWKLIRKSIEN